MTEDMEGRETRKMGRRGGKIIGRFTAGTFGASLAHHVSQLPLRSGRDRNVRRSFFKRLFVVANVADRFEPGAL